MKKVTMETSMGTISLELDEEKALATVKNFVEYAKAAHYDGTIFHRVIDGFMIQGGDPRGNGTGGPGYTIKDEFMPDNRNNRGTIAMANAGPNTGGSQFFINLVDNNYLDKAHPAFGTVVEGFDVVEKIGKVKTNWNDKPEKDVVINEAVVL